MKVSDLTKILESICRKPENSLCADCNNKNPTWASIDFGVLICLNCSGAHRALGPSITRVRSTSLDQWQEAWLAFLTEGNVKINEYLEFNLNKNKKPCSNSSQEYINGFVHDKYVKRKYINASTNDPMDKTKHSPIQKMETKNTENSKSKQPSLQKQRNGEKIQKIFSTNANEFIRAATNFQSYNPKAKDQKRQTCSLKVLNNTIKVGKKKTKEMDFDFDFEKAKIKKGCSNSTVADSFSQFAFTKAQSLNVQPSSKFDFLPLKQTKSANELQNCEESRPYDKERQKLYTFEDIFTRTAPQPKGPKNIDPFGILF